MRDKLRLGSIVLLLFGVLVTGYQCSVRKHNNIFDPKSGIDTLNMKLELRRADSVIVLTWSPHFQVRIKGFHLYRKVGNDSRFSSLAILAPTQNEYHDSLVQYDTPYAYYLTLIGTSNESPPTPVLKTVPGPGTIWILDRWNEYILKFSYDMRHTLLTHYAIWIPQALSFNTENSVAIITYPLYHYAEVLDPFYGSLRAEITGIRYPYACSFNPKNQEFWISDTAGALYRYNMQSGLQLLDGRLLRPLAIAFDAQGRAIVMDRKMHALILYHADGTRRAEITGFNGRRFKQLIFLTANFQRSCFYLIERRDTTDVLYRISTLNDSLTLLLAQQGMAAVRESPLDRSLWIAVNGNNTAKIMQLSPTGLRLNTLNGFMSITDFAINPLNGNLVVADRTAHRVVHLTKTGRLIGRFDKAPYPFKVYIE